MTDERRRLLISVGFKGKKADDLPSMQEIRLHFKKECLLRHPDKPGGSKEAFQQLLRDYDQLIRLNRSEYACANEEVSEERYFEEFSLYGN